MMNFAGTADRVMAEVAVIKMMTKNVVNFDAARLQAVSFYI